MTERSARQIPYRGVAPAVFANFKDDSLLEQYRFVTSDSQLNPMEGAGFLVVGVQE